MSHSEIAFDISEYLLPLNTNDIFGNNRRTGLEIGFGGGEFITELGYSYPDWNYIGIEVKYYRFLKALRLAESKKLQNIRLIHIEAHIALQEIFTPCIFDKVYINFPDPWPKEKHLKHRLINQQFLINLNTVMKKNSEIEFVSDSRDYIDHTTSHFNMFSGFQSITTSDHNISTRPSTRFMEEFRQEDRNIYYLSYRKIQQ